MADSYVHKSGRAATEDEATYLVEGKRVLKDGYGPLVNIFMMDGTSISSGPPSSGKKTADDWIRQAHAEAAKRANKSVEAWLKTASSETITAISQQAIREMIEAGIGEGVQNVFSVDDAKAIRDQVRSARYAPRDISGRQSEPAQPAQHVDLTDLAAATRDYVRQHRYASNL